MINYKLLEAFAAVIQEKGFEKASKKLHITQSAISQRIKLLEEIEGRILIIRSVPPETTPYGKKLLKHFNMVVHLENQLRTDISKANPRGFKTIIAGVNEDSLATWFLDAVQPFLMSDKYLIDIKVDDQAETDKMLKNGKVFGCISSNELKISGCKSFFLGKMRYSAAANFEFAEKYFSSGFNKKNIKAAPCVIFNRKDMLQHAFFSDIMGVDIKNFPSHYVPSSEKFLDFILKGYGYGMVPHIQSNKFFKSEKLKKIYSESLDVNLYWNCWDVKSELIDKFTKILCENAKRLLI